MSDRPEVGDFLSIHARPTFSPAARAVDTYTTPSRNSGGSGQALLSALSQLDGSLSPALRRESRRAAQSEYDEGQELFQQNRTDFAEAVRTGAIPAGASPFVRRGFRESSLHVIGATYNIELQRALEHSNLHEMDDPAQVEQFIQAFQAEFTEVNGLADLPPREVQRIFNPIATQANDGFRNRQAQDNIEFVEERRFAAFEAELYMAVNQGRFTGPEGSASANASNLQQWLQARAQEMYEEGIDYELIQNSVLNAVGRAAVESGSISSAGVLNGISIGGMPPIGASPEGREVQRRVRAAAAAREAARNRAANAAVSANRTQRSRDLQTAAQAAARAGDMEEADRILAQLNTINPTHARAVDGFIRRHQGDLEDVEAAGTFANVLQGVSITDNMTEALDIIDEASIHGNLAPEAANQLERIADRRHNRTPADPLTIYEGDRQLQSIGSSLGDHFPPSEFGIAIPENADAHARAEAAYTDEVLDWIASNADEDGNYNRMDARTAAQSAREAALSIYAPSRQTEGGSNETDTPDPDWYTEE